MSKDWYTSAVGEVEHFMLTTPSCESKAPKDWKKMESNWNTFIYYKKFEDQKTKNDAKDFCHSQGMIFSDSNAKLSNVVTPISLGYKGPIGYGP